MKIDYQLVDKIASLASLRIKEAEKPVLSEQLTKILGHMRVLDEVNVKGVEPMFHGCVEQRELRNDDVRPFDPCLIMKNSCSAGNGYFAVPNIITGEDEQ